MKKPTVRHLKKKLDKVYSDYIRQRDSGKCYTCNKVAPWKETQCGHYISRSYTNLRFNEKNTHAQCVGCNIFKSGNLPVYALKLIDDYGIEILAELERAKRVERRFTVKELESLIEEYKLKDKL